MEAVITMFALSVLNGILGSQPRDKVSMLNDNTVEFFLRSLLEIGLSSQWRDAFVRVIQHGRHDVTWKPAIWPLINKNTFKGSPTINQYDQLTLFHLSSHIFFSRCIGTKSHNISQNVASPMLPNAHRNTSPGLSWESLWKTLTL